MKPILAYYWKHRWCRYLALGLFLCAAPFFHQRVRDAVTGRIHGQSHAAWKRNIRAWAKGDVRPKSWVEIGLEKVGLPEKQQFLNLRDEAFLPVIADLTEDDDDQVRYYCLQTLEHWVDVRWPEVSAVFRRHLEDIDPNCRLFAAEAICRVALGTECTPALLGLCNNSDQRIRQRAIFTLYNMSLQASEVSTPLAKLVSHHDPYVRHWATLGVLKGGRPNLPVIRAALADSNAQIRVEAVLSAHRAGKDAIELVPELAMMRDREIDLALHRLAAAALAQIDPKQFSPPVD